MSDYGQDHMEDIIKEEKDKFKNPKLGKIAYVIHFTPEEEETFLRKLAEEDPMTHADLSIFGLTIREANKRGDINKR